VDDSLLSGTPKALDHLQRQLRKHFKCKFLKPKDFLGLDIDHPTLGEITLSMKSFTNKMATVLDLKDTYPGVILTPGRTDKKTHKDQDPEPNNNYRSHVGTLNWLSMGVRFDVVYTTKELSRVLATPTSTANEIVRRALLYLKRTSDAHLVYSHTNMMAFTMPPTRKKPTDVTDNYDTSEYNIDDGIKQEDINQAKTTTDTQDLPCTFIA
jgi:hypothetical protein